MKNVLVTGGTGYIGSHTTVRLIEKGYNPIIVDNLHNSSKKCIEGIERITGKSPIFYKIDVRDYDKMKSIFKKTEITGIIHFASLRYVDESTDIPLEYFDANINGVITLLKLVKEFSVSSFVFSSSCSVYGDIETLPVLENSPLNTPQSPYATSKLIGEQLLESIKNSVKTNFISLRYFNPVGAHLSGEIGEDPKQIPPTIILRITRTALGQFPVLKVLGHKLDTRDGSCIRDYIHVMDVAEAHVLAMRKLENTSQFHNHYVVNIGSGAGVSVLELINAFQKYTGESLNYELCDPRPGDVVSVYADNSYARELLGWEPKLGIKEMISSAWEWEKRKFTS